MPSASTISTVEGPERSAESQLPSGRLVDAALRGARWLTLARVASEIFVFGSSVVLARLVSPADFGHAAVVRIVPVFAIILTFEGLGTRLVQRETVGPDELRSANALSLVLGAVLSLITFVGAPWVAGPLFGSPTTDLLRPGGVSFVLAG